MHTDVDRLPLVSSCIINVDQDVVFAKDAVLARVVVEKVADHVEVTIHTRPAFFSVGNESSVGDSWVRDGNAGPHNGRYIGNTEALRHGNFANMVVEIKTVDCVTHIKRTKVPFKSLLFILQKKERGD
jgi:hypothetical protein